jgi:S-disulfanyl-L-cysteine oxidoreductase SoxD
MSARPQTFGFGRSWQVLGHALVTGTLISVASGLAYAQAPRTVQDGVFTDAQASRGQAIYGKQCASCHGETLKGAQAPPLVGDVFLSNWRTLPLSELANKIRNTMPADAMGTLTPPQSADLVAHLLKSGSFPTGRTELASAEAALTQITWPQQPVAARAAAPAALGRVFPPLGNMAQLMRGVFFPNSNLIFTVQTHDPGAPAPAPAAGAQAGGFSWVDWGAGIYGGWQLVDNAAIALADASPLMLTPGIRCENGRLAPVTDADWIKFTEQMIAVARKTYRASQSRNQEAVSDATGDLSDACANCHQAYRDIRVPGRAQGSDPIDPSNKAARCMSR